MCNRLRATYNMQMSASKPHAQSSTTKGPLAYGFGRSHKAAAASMQRVPKRPLPYSTICRVLQLPHSDPAPAEAAVEAADAADSVRHVCAFEACADGAAAGDGEAAAAAEEDEEEEEEAAAVGVEACAEAPATAPEPLSPDGTEAAEPPRGSAVLPDPPGDGAAGGAAGAAVPEPARSPASSTGTQSDSFSERSTSSSVSSDDSSSMRVVPTGRALHFSTLQVGSLQDLHGGPPQGPTPAGFGLPLPLPLATRTSCKSRWTSGSLPLVSCAAAINTFAAYSHSFRSTRACPLRIRALADFPSMAKASSALLTASSKSDPPCTLR